MMSDFSSTMNESVKNFATEVYPPWSIPIICSLSILGLSGNVLVCFTIQKTTFLHTTTNYLIVNLAIADSLVCIFSALQVLWNNFMTYPSSEIGKHFFCHLLSSDIFMWLSATGSSFALVFVSLERFIGIVYPLHYSLLITKKRVRVALICQWIIAVISEGHATLFTVYDGNENNCFFKLYVGFFTVQIIISYGFPVVTLTYLYYRMFSSLTTTPTPNGRNNCFDARRKENRRARNNVLINLFIVTILFVVFWTPCQVFFFTGNFREGVNKARNSGTYIIAVYILTLCNSVVNPFVYCFRYKQFQRALRIHELPFKGCDNLKWH